MKEACLLLLGIEEEIRYKLNNKYILILLYFRLLPSMHYMTKLSLEKDLVFYGAIEMN